MIILGLGGFDNDASCAVLRDGELVAAVEERKVARPSANGSLPQSAIAAALDVARLTPADVNCVALVRPFEHQIHLTLRAQFPNAQVLMVEHHAAHAASAYFPSQFDEATVLTLDRDGDFRSAARWRASGNQLHLEKDLYYPDSLADLYSRITELLGFAAGSDEHKVQWLSTADSGERFQPLFEEILGRSDWPSIDRSFFDADRLSQGGFSEKFYARLGLEDGAEIPAALRAPLAAGLQSAIEKMVLCMAGPAQNLCLAGGLAMNTLLVNALEKSKHVFVQPAAGNAGTALGAVFYAWNNVFGEKRRSSLKDLCLGPEYSAEEVKKVLENCKLGFHYLMTTDELLARAVRDLNSEKRIIAWMQGRMEFGPRALGNRSILASPLNPYSTENLNIYIKHRESFRKFAASVPEEAASEYFEVGPNARYLATVGRVRPRYRKIFEAAVLGDDAVRVHLVKQEDNPLFHKLLLAAGKATELPVLYNTSFNLFGDPLVCSPRDAVRSFYSSGIDALYVGNFVLEK
ncbi:MAG TPA: carbamoyltransferase C-terminal domain-containing protein [Bryobacteraceae bacterium]|nr:carbamoyltransferase C-terminal domain-containing protein [Bryobacteraceae bacterium]